MTRRTKRRIGLFLSLVGLQLALLFSALNALAVRQTSLAFTSTSATLWTAPSGITFVNLCGYGGGGGWRRWDGRNERRCCDVFHGGSRWWGQSDRVSAGFRYAWDHLCVRGWSGGHRRRGCGGSGHGRRCFDGCDRWGCRHRCPARCRSGVGRCIAILRTGMRRRPLGPAAMVQRGQRVEHRKRAGVWRIVVRIGSARSVYVLQRSSLPGVCCGGLSGCHMPGGRSRNERDDEHERGW